MTRNTHFSIGTISKLRTILAQSIITDESARCAKAIDKDMIGAVHTRTLSSFIAMITISSIEVKSRAKHTWFSIRCWFAGVARGIRKIKLWTIWAKASFIQTQAGHTLILYIIIDVMLWALYTFIFFKLERCHAIFTCQLVSRLATTSTYATSKIVIRAF